MLTLPSGIEPASVVIRAVDFGFEQEAAGGNATRIDRPGNRWEAVLQFPLVNGEAGRVLTRRIQRARQEGLRISVPLLGVTQGTGGAPLVDGSASSGRTLNLKGLTAAYVVKEGYWLTVVDAAGTRYLHQCAADATADGSGKATATIDPPLRHIPANGDTVIIGAPTIEGRVVDVVEWQTDPAGTLAVKACTLRESV